MLFFTSLTWLNNQTAPYGGHQKPRGIIMEQVKFGIAFTVNSYALGELDNFVECADGLSDDNELAKRYVDFVDAVSAKKVKASTLVDVDVLAVFADDLHWRASIDYLENHWDNEPAIVAGGKMFYGRYNKLKAVHGSLIK